MLLCCAMGFPGVPGELVELYGANVVRWIGFLAIPSGICVALGAYRFAITPRTAETSEDWSTFAIGLFLFSVSAVGVTLALLYGGRFRPSIGLGIPLGGYLLSKSGWRLANYYRHAGRIASDEQSD